MRKKVIIFVTLLVVALIFAGGAMWYFSHTAPSDKVDNADGLTLRSLYIDPYEFHSYLESLNSLLDREDMTKETAKLALDTILRRVENLSLYPDYINSFTVKQKREICGAIEDENPIGGGVTLASDRGKNSSGGMIYTTAIRSRPIIEAGENVRITGLTIKGPDPKVRNWNKFCNSVGITTKESNLEVDNCEISGFNFASIEITGGNNHRIHHNYIHHNRGIPGGNGIFVKKASVKVEYNLFNYNRHSVHGDSSKDCSLKVSNNVEMGTAYEECIKMDTLGRGDNTTYGNSLIIYNNTYLTVQTPYAFSKLPKEGGENKLLRGNDKKEERLLFRNNAFNLLENTSVSVLDDDELLPAHTPDMKTTNITSRIFYGDTEKAYQIIKSIKKNINNENVGLNDVKNGVLQAIGEIEQYGRVYEYIKQPYIQKDGKKYGAIPSDEPFGGGIGYSDILTTGDYVVKTAEELFDALLKVKSGEVIFVKGDAKIDLTVHMTRGNSLIIKDGVTLASNRGYKGSPGGLIYTDSYSTPMIKAGENVRITGLCLQGADPKRRIEHHTRSFKGFLNEIDKNFLEAKGRTYYYKLRACNGIKTNDSNLTVDNCEITGFSHAAISISGGTGHHIHHNYIHNNQRHGLGYGIAHNKSISLIEYNLFNYNRHSIAGTGAPGSGYEAYNNIEMGASLSHCFDMHGGRAEEQYISCGYLSV